ncbi:MAG: hypothetical protein V4550_03955 [Gemmatimonadota bacterium]
MTDSRRTLGEGAFGPEPSRDVKLGALLREIEGVTPDASVDWAALASRIADGVAAQASSSSWWDYATRWERRVVPLALAAGLAASFALWNASLAAPSGVQFVTSSSISTAVADGAPPEDAAATFATAITNAVDPMIGVPE